MADGGISLAVIAALSAAATAAQAQSNARRAANQQEQQNEAIRKAAAEGYADQALAENDNAAQSLKDSIQAQGEFQKAVGRVTVQSGATGTSGSSIDAILHDLRATHGQNLAQINQNRTFATDAFLREANASRFQAQRSQGSRYFAGPGIGATIGNVASAGAQGFLVGNKLSTNIKEASSAG